MAALYLWRDIGPGFYQRAGLYRRELSWSDKLRFRIGRQYVRLLRRFNDPAYLMMLRNKSLEKAVLSQLGVANTPFYGVFHPQSGRDHRGQALRTAQDVLDLLSRESLQRVAVKLVEGYEGRGFDIVQVGENPGTLFSEASQQSVDAEAYLAERLAQCPDLGLLLEAPITQHPALAALNPSSVNTLRLWVTAVGQPRVRSALLKMGAEGALVDYSSKGGAAAVVSLEDGRVGPLRLRAGAAGPAAAPGEDFLVPYFAEACQLAENCLALLPGIRFAGFDLAITPEGPLVVELNDQPDPSHAAALGIPTLDLLEPLPG